MKHQCDKHNCKRNVHVQDSFDIGCKGECGHCNRHCIHYHIFEAINLDKWDRMLPNFEKYHTYLVYKALYNGRYHRHNMERLEQKRNEYRKMHEYNIDDKNCTQCSNNCTQCCINTLQVN